MAGASSALAQTAAGPLSIDPESYDFEEIEVGSQSDPKTFTVTNQSGGVVNDLEVTLDGADTDDFQLDPGDCGEELGPEDSCELEATFSPSSEGPKQVEVEVEGMDRQGSASAHLTGVGIPPGCAIDLRPSVVDYGRLAVGSTMGAFLNADNVGQASCTLSELELVGDDADELELIEGATCVAGKHLGPGESCWLMIVFEPLTEGEKVAVFRLFSNAPGSPHTASLLGIAVEPRCRILVSPLSIDYGSRPVGEGRAFEMGGFFSVESADEDVGDGPCTISQLDVAGDDAHEFELVDGATCVAGKVLNPGENCWGAVLFTPSSVGEKTGLLRVFSDAPASPTVRPLQGVGVPAERPTRLEVQRARLRPGGPGARSGSFRSGSTHRSSSRAGRHLAIRGSLDPRAAGERLEVRFRAAGREMTLRQTIGRSGRFVVNRRLRGSQRRAGGGQVRIRYPGGDSLRAVGQRLRVARRPVGLRFRRARIRGEQLIVAGRVHRAARGRVQIEIEFNRPDGAPAQIATRAKVHQRGRFRTRLRVPPAVRDRGAWLAVTHPGRGRLFGQRIGRSVGG